MHVALEVTLLVLFAGTLTRADCASGSLLTAQRATFRDASSFRCLDADHNDLCEYPALRPLVVVCTNEDPGGGATTETDVERVMRRWNHCVADNDRDSASLDMHCPSRLPPCEVVPERDCWVYYSPSYALLHLLMNALAWFFMTVTCCCCAGVAYFTRCCFFMRLRWNRELEAHEA